MKKLVLMILMFLFLCSLYAVSLSPSLIYKSDNTTTAVYGELVLSGSYAELGLALTFDMGYDFISMGPYDSLGFKAGLNFDWGEIFVSQSIGVNPVTMVKIGL